MMMMIPGNTSCPQAELQAEQVTGQMDVTYLHYYNPAHQILHA